MPPTIYLASGNRHKAEELQELAVARAVQVLRRFARVLMRAAGAVAVLAKLAPGTAPVELLTRPVAVAKALARPCALVAEAPMLPPAERNWESAQAETTVVTSLMVYTEDVVIELHAPMAERSVMAGLGEVEEPTVPPVASR